jgi:uncharacterized protein (UPF0548 family)
MDEGVRQLTPKLVLVVQAVVLVWVVFVRRPRALSVLKDENHSWIITRYGAIFQMMTGPRWAMHFCEIRCAVGVGEV